MRGALRVGLLAVASCAPGCQTPVGHYFAERAREFGECFRVEVSGPHLGLGVGVRAAGLLDIGLMASLTSRSGTAAWTYGDGNVGYAGLPRLMDFGQATDLELFAGPHQCHRGRWDHSCWGLLPAVFSRVPTAESGADPNPSVVRHTWLWASDAWPRARVHAFDVEVSVRAVLVGVRLGFSPGEFVDFLLGWFGLDIAGDDRPFSPESSGRGR